MSAAPRWGLTLPFDGVALRDHKPLIQQAEAAGWQDLWTGENQGHDGFTPLALAATWTSELRLGTGIVNPFTRGPLVLAQTAASLQDASGGRFVLGLGSSSNVIVEHWNERPFQKPLSAVRDAVTTIRTLLEGGRGPGGGRLTNAPETAPPIVVAAQRDRMLRLGGELGDGTLTNFVPVSGIGHVIEQVRAGGDRGSQEILCRFFNVPGSVEEGLPIARRMLVAYATVPVYERFFASLGWEERMAPMVAAWRDGDRAKALELVPDELVQEVFVLGPPEAQKEHMQRFMDAGVTTCIVSPMAKPDALPGLIDAFAPS